MKRDQVLQALVLEFDQYFLTQEFEGLLEDGSGKLPIAEALVEMLQQATPEQGQHDLMLCKFCYAEQQYHAPHQLVHRPGCIIRVIEDRVWRTR